MSIRIDYYVLDLKKSVLHIKIILYIYKFLVLWIIMKYFFFNLFANITNTYLEISYQHLIVWCMYASKCKIHIWHWWFNTFFCHQISLLFETFKFKLKKKTKKKKLRWSLLTLKVTRIKKTQITRYIYIFLYFGSV